MTLLGPLLGSQMAPIQVAAGALVSSGSQARAGSGSQLPDGVAPI